MTPDSSATTNGYMDARMYSSAIRLFDISSKHESIRFINRHGALRAQCTPSQLLEFGHMYEGMPVRVHVHAIGDVADDRWQVDQIQELPAPHIDGLKLLPVSLCPDRHAATSFAGLSLDWGNPGLRSFASRVFSNDDFAHEYIRASCWINHAAQFGSMLAEAAFAAVQIEANPFLNQAQREVARLAVLLNRPGREWRSGNPCRYADPPPLRLRQLDIVWMQENFPAQMEKLEAVWAALNKETLDDLPPLTRDITLACWGALRSAAEAMNPIGSTEYWPKP